MVSETHLIQLIFKAQTCKKCERNRERMQRQIVPKWLTKVCMWKRWNDISGHYSLYININFLSFLFFLVLFGWLFFYLVLVFFQKSSKNQWEELVEKTCFVFFLKDYFLPEKKEQPLWWLLVQHLPQQFCSCSLTAVSSAYLRVLHVRMQTNKSLFNRGSSHTCTVRSSQYHLFNWSCRKTHQFRSDLITQCKAHLLRDTAMARSGFPLLDFAKVVESIAWATARRLLSWNSFKGADLLLF